VIFPSYNHAFMAFGLCPRVEGDLDDKIINLLWTRKKDGRVTQGRRLVAKNRVSASFEMGGLKMSLTAETVCGLLLNIFFFFFQYLGPFFLSWIRILIRIPNADLDRADQNQCGSGSATLQ
jgi:hypothetical protein